MSMLLKHLLPSQPWVLAAMTGGGPVVETFLLQHRERAIAFIAKHRSAGWPVRFLAGKSTRPLYAEPRLRDVAVVYCVGVKAPLDRMASLEALTLPPAILFEHRGACIAAWRFDPDAPAVTVAEAEAIEKTLAERLGGERLNFFMPIPKDGTYKFIKDRLASAAQLAALKISGALGCPPEVVQQAEALESVLLDYGVPVTIKGARPGPVITLFDIGLPPGTKASQVAGLADDLARSLGCQSARIVRSPSLGLGGNAIGIELPNPTRQIVMLSAVLQSPVYRDSQAALPLALGVSTAGDPIVVDLARMPHLLIAGTTGSGKSVGLNTMIQSLLTRLSSSQCNFIMIDPKMLELSSYEGIPHLLAPVVTEPESAVRALQWVGGEMDRRYQLMKGLNVRNLASYNAACAERMPYIVVVIDEVADLMMVAEQDIEHAVQRLAQKARAAGIHLIMATQRPSVDVLTGTIKANFPSRIGFHVPSQHDSKTILNQIGAEQLLGEGDMLYMASGGQITRVHGAFVSDAEIEATARQLRAGAKPNYHPDLLDLGEAPDQTLACGEGAAAPKKRDPIVIKRDPVGALAAWLREFLASGPKTASKVRAAAKAAGFSVGGTLVDARELVGIEIEEVGGRNVSNLWRLPEQP
jgi:hypothetical protein